MKSASPSEELLDLILPQGAVLDEVHVHTAQHRANLVVSLAPQKATTRKVTVTAFSLCF